MAIQGRVWKYGDNIDTDAIIPARYLNTTSEQEMASHCMEDWDPSFVKGVQPGDIVVAGKNFGCGSSREHAPLALKASGVACVIAETFARIFYRNSLNIGLPILESPEAAQAIEAGDMVQIDLSAGTIVNTRTGKTYTATPYPEFMLALIEAGGLVEYTRRRLAAGN
ncbi:MAG: 3-isopropylmalate dehydratase small subunit [Anaerolineae bacterium]|nr:3-isopropylmalate dehydratase small subunit [Chloroflexota bacterium]